MNADDVQCCDNLAFSYVEPNTPFNNELLVVVEPSVCDVLTLFQNFVFGAASDTSKLWLIAPAINLKISLTWVSGVKLLKKLPPKPTCHGLDVGYPFVILLVVIPVEELGFDSVLSDWTFKVPLTSKLLCVDCIEPVGENIPSCPSIASAGIISTPPVSYTHLRAHET